MGVGLSEHRSAIGRFACVAKYARDRRQKRKWREPKLTKFKKVDSGDDIPSNPKSVKLKESSRSLDRWMKREKTHYVERRSKFGLTTRISRGNTARSSIFIPF